MATTTGQSVLVTGASGFIGSHLVRRLVAGGYRLSCLVRRTSVVDELRATGASLVEGDVNDRASVAKAMAESRPAVVFHVAGIVRALSAEEGMRVNTDGAGIVAAACVEWASHSTAAGESASGTAPVFVLVSSLAAAGPMDASPKTERDPSIPVSAYGRSKFAGERAVAKFAGALPITIVRPCVVFGPGDRGVFEVFKPIARSGVSVVPGRGDRRVSLIAVADLVECIILAAEKGERLAPDASASHAGGVDGATGSAPASESLMGRGVYFASSVDMSYVELSAAISRALGRTRTRIVHLPEWVMRIIGPLADALARVRRRPMWVSSDKISDVLAGSWVCSSSKAREQLGWSPAASLDERLVETVRWYRERNWL